MFRNASFGAKHIQKIKEEIATEVRLEWKKAYGNTSGVLGTFYFLTDMLVGFCLLEFIFSVHLFLK